VTYNELNSVLRDVTRVIYENFSGVHGIKTKLVKLLMGSSTVVAFADWLEGKRNFGIKPLSRIVESTGKQLYMVALDPSDPLVGQLRQKNIEFANELKELLTYRLENWEITEKEVSRITRIAEKIDNIFELARVKLPEAKDND